MQLAHIEQGKQWLWLVVLLATSFVCQPCYAAEVLIYFANENAPDAAEGESYDQVCRWLHSSSTSAHQRLADQLERDRLIFPAAVDVEVAEISLELPRIASAPHALLFTNRLVREGKCLLWKTGSDKVEEVRFIAPPTEDFILRSNPCARRETLSAALNFAALHFDPQHHEFILVTKSHGSDNTALTPRLAVQAGETNREELLRVASDSSDDELPAWVGKRGVSKADYVAVLREAYDRHQMRFALVFMESCHASAKIDEMGELPSNVQRLLVVRENTNYINLLWADVLQRLHNDGEMPGGRLSEAILVDLPPKFAVITANGMAEHVPNRWSASAVSLWVYFLPLVAWFVWIGYRVHASSRRRHT